MKYFKHQKCFFKLASRNG